MTSIGETDQDLRQRLLRLPPKQRRALLASLTGGGPSEATAPDRPRFGAFPATPAQASQWFLWQVEPDGNAYHVGYLYDLRGPLSVPALTGAVADLVARHDALRTTFRQDGDNVAQVIGPPPDEAVRDHTAPDVDTALAAAQELLRAPFDLRTGPLYRADLWTCGPDRHVLAIACHHSVVDEWSSRVIESDLTACYLARTGAAAPPPAPRQYVDRAVMPSRATLRAGLRYWTEQLAGSDPTALPADDVAPAGRRALARHQVVLASDVLAGVDAIARSLDTTRYVVLVALWWTFLARQSGRTDVCAGTPVTGRDSTASDVVGFFLNTLVLRGKLDIDAGFAEAARQARDVLAAAMRHQDTPLDEVLRAVGVPRGSGRDPLFHSMFAYVSTADDTGCAVRLPGVDVRPVPLANTDAQFDLLFLAFDHGDTMTLCLDYAAAAYRPATAQHWGTVLEYILRTATANPDAPLAELLAATPDEKGRLRAWRDEDSLRIAYAETEAALGRPVRTARTSKSPIPDGYPMVEVPGSVSDPSGVLAAVQRGEIDTLHATVPQLESFVAAGVFAVQRPPALVIVDASPDPVPDAVVVAGTRIETLYRFGTAVTSTLPQVIGPDGAELPIGVVGSLWVHGSDTGFSGRVRADGTLELRHPAHTITVADVSVDVHAVESAARRLPGVVRAVAVTDSANSALTLYVVVEDGVRMSERALRAAVSRVAGQELPVRLMRLPRLPLTDHGDVDRERLAAVAKPR